ncbi:hypothetical protein BV20DRAFT_999200 [Pilatotrama ljubarskyi]|nr:hypothetical protein BV20DRAFT_999200 [Pilatotrama ljubarskyi]
MRERNVRQRLRSPRRRTCPSPGVLLGLCVDPLTPPVRCFRPSGSESPARGRKTMGSVQLSLAPLPQHPSPSLRVLC